VDEIYAGTAAAAAASDFTLMLGHLRGDKGPLAAVGKTLSDGALRQWIEKLTVVHVPPATPLFRVGELVTCAAVVVKGELQRHEANSVDSVVVVRG
jgi:hypothetical protein